MSSRTFDADDAQRRVLDHSSGPLLVTGSAGTGKTAVLRERFARLIESGADPERIVLVVGSRRARDEARADMVRRIPRSLPMLRVTTIHGLAYQVVNARYSFLEYEGPPEILSAPDQFALVRELLDGEDPAHWPAYGSMLGMRGFADEVRQFIIRAQESLLRPEDIQRLAATSGLSGWRELSAFYGRYLQVLDARGAVDFAALVEQAAVAAPAEPLFDHVIVDDYQDTTFGAEALLAGLKVESLVVAGDPQAHVFSFQGTTDLPLERFADRFGGTGHVHLSTRHRGPRVRFEAWHTAHRSEEHIAVARELVRIHVQDGVPWDELAVVVRRQGDHVGGLLRALDDAGIPRAVPEAGLSLTAEPATRPYLLALRWIAYPAGRDTLIEPLLTSELVRLSPADARGLIRAARAERGSPAAALELTDRLGPGRTEAVSAVRTALQKAERAGSALDAFRVLWRSLPSSRRLVEGSASGAQAGRDLDAVMALAESIGGGPEGRDRSVSAFLESLAAGDEGPGVGATDGSRPDAVRVVTAHGTAGREFDTVIVVGAVEGDFPSLSRPEPMFDLGTIERRVSQSERNRLRLQDERRLFHVVASRARRRVLFTASDGHGDEAAVTPRSRFVDELVAGWSPAPSAPFPEPVSIAEAAAAWRRELADPSAPSTARLAALDGILALGLEPKRWWFQREWTDTGRPLHDEVRTSYSRLDTLENCELQYVLAEELGLGSPAGYHAWTGKLVHELIEDCEAGRVERSPEALIAAVDQRWRPQEFPSLAVSEAFRRLVTERMLPNWFQHFASTPAMASEVEFTFDFEEATIKGYIDRIGPILAGGNRITDFKTGKPDKAPKAEDSLQLAIYYLAVLESEALAPYRPVRGVELAFLRGRWKDGNLERRGWQMSSGSEEEYQTRVRQRLSALIRRIRELVRSETYRPNPAADCFFCDFKTLCPLYPEGAPLFTIPEPESR